MVQNQNISNRNFDKPLYIIGGITGEPISYLAEIPFELSKYEFSILKRGKIRNDTWFEIITGATLGMILSILGKTIIALIEKQSPSFEKWELCSIIAGVIIALIFKCRKKSSDEKEFDKINMYIEQHFKTNQKRKIHISSDKGGNS